AGRRLLAGGVENGVQEGRWMVELLQRECSGEAAPEERLEEWIRRRIAGEPFQYIVGSTEFHTVELAVGPGVLVPRPETEELVERALEILRDAPAGSCVLDLCTGSGAIPLALSAIRPDLDYTGIDISPEALKWAELNRSRLSPPKCRFLQGDLCAPLGTPSPRFVLVTANPPYISPEDYRELPGEVKDYEPRLALEAEDNGLELEKKCALQGREFLLSGGAVLMEIGESQGAEMAAFLEANGFVNVKIRKDIFGRDRIAEAWKK
ncbi:MAG: peptide chain release factor N(5)-glutamine methyltransferase, partial [Victivallales bacterium]|nr:peptide chain release factor N(5)-glutamine methyltransferase [Victivallales bacterium]